MGSTETNAFLVSTRNTPFEWLQNHALQRKRCIKAKNLFSWYFPLWKIIEIRRTRLLLFKISDRWAKDQTLKMRYLCWAILLCWMVLGYVLTYHFLRIARNKVHYVENRSFLITCNSTTRFVHWSIRQSVHRFIHQTLLLITQLKEKKKWVSHRLLVT